MQASDWSSVICTAVVPRNAAGRAGGCQVTGLRTWGEPFALNVVVTRAGLARYSAIWRVRFASGSATTRSYTTS